MHFIDPVVVESFISVKSLIHSLWLCCFRKASYQWSRGLMTCGSWLNLWLLSSLATSPIWLNRERLTLQVRLSELFTRNSCSVHALRRLSSGNDSLFVLKHRPPFIAMIEANYFQPKPYIKLLCCTFFMCHLHLTLFHTEWIWPVIW